MLVFRVLAFIWPFLKEMFLGDKTLLQALKERKGRVFIIAVIMLSIFLNFVTIPKLFQISTQYVTLKKKYIESKQETAKVEEGDTRGETPTTPAEKKVEPPNKENKEVIPTPTPPPSVQKPDANLIRYRKMKESFERIKAREEKEQFPHYPS